MATAKKPRRKPAAKKVNKTENNLRNMLILGLLVGALAGFVVAKMAKQPVAQRDNTPSVAAEKPAKKEAVEPTYDFYTLLPEMEVEVSQNKPAPVARVEKPEVTPTEPPKEQTAEEMLAAALEKEEVAVVVVEENPADYMLQVGSFRDTAVADRYKAKLALLGIESKVQTVTIDNTNTWHRVLVGPITGRTKADALKARLKEDNIDSLMVRVKKG